MSKGKVIGFINNDKYDDALLEPRCIRSEDAEGVTDIYTLRLHHKPVEKRYVLPMEGTDDDEGEYFYYAYKYNGRWLVDETEADPSYTKPTVTQAEIDAAPDWVKAITPVEVTDHD
ncbi:MAG: hypothetical protein LKJ69_01625 [Lactobacillus sp.]|jgi:hypothetical protein|nr:hypothetical protein [Lactobacillus sp.]MCI2032083.1 hypothetical protein [Lactobacillus sp.]